MNVVEVVLLGMVASASALGCAGLLLGHGAHAQLHCVSFATATALPAAALAVLLADPSWASAFKLAFLVAASLAGGAVLAHVTGRALFLRRLSEKR